MQQLREDAHTTRSQLTVKQQEAAQALQQITERMSEVSERKRQVQELQTQLAEEETKLQGRKGIIEEKLSDVQPLLEKTRKAVGAIRKDNINEIRAFRMPPPAIHDVLTAVLMLMGEFDNSWLNMKSFLASPSVKDRIVNFDARFAHTHAHAHMHPRANGPVTETSHHRCARRCWSTSDRRQPTSSTRVLST